MTAYLTPYSNADISRYRGRATIGEILRVALPFVVSSGAFAVKLFCDRVMLAWHSDLAMYAALSSGTAAFMVAGLFIGISGYVSAFVSQYHGAGQNYKIGVSVWQSVILSLVFGALIAALGQLLVPAFILAGHPAELAALEAEYFRLLTAGAVFSLGLEVNYELNPWENGRLIPFAGLRYQRLKQDSLQESTATGLMPLNVRSADGDTFTSTLGLTLEHNFQFENGGVFTPRLTAAWRHEFGDRNISIRYDIAGVSLITKADSMEQAANAFDLGASFVVIPMKCGEVDFGLNGGYTASFSSDRLEHNFYGGVEIKF